VVATTAEATIIVHIAITARPITMAAVTIIITDAGSGTVAGTHTASVRAGAGRPTTTSSPGFATERLVPGALTSRHGDRGAIARGLFYCQHVLFSVCTDQLSCPTRFFLRLVACSPMTFSASASNRR
jgi:hypothetical protein